MKLSKISMFHFDLKTKHICETFRIVKLKSGANFEGDIEWCKLESDEGKQSKDTEGRWSINLAKQSVETNSKIWN